MPRARRVTPDMIHMYEEQLVELDLQIAKLISKHAIVWAEEQAQGVRYFKESKEIKHSIDKLQRVRDGMRAKFEALPRIVDTYQTELRERREKVTTMREYVEGIEQKLVTLCAEQSFEVLSNMSGKIEAQIRQANADLTMARRMLSNYNRNLFEFEALETHYMQHPKDMPSSTRTRTLVRNGSSSRKALHDRVFEPQKETPKPTRESIEQRLENVPLELKLAYEQGQVIRTTLKTGTNDYLEAAAKSSAASLLEVLNGPPDEVVVEEDPSTSTSTEE